MTVFPKGKHEDQVNSTAQFLDWFKRPMPSWGIFELTRRMAEKLKPPEPVYVRLKAPPGIRCGANLLRSTHHDRGGPHRRDVRGRCRLLDPCRLDQARRIEPAQAA